MRVPGYFSRMTKDPTRNHRIAHDYLAGKTTASIAIEHNLSVLRVREIAKEMRPLIALQGERSIPAGISLQAAVRIEQTIGIWPCADNAAEIAGRRWDLKRSHGRLRPFLDELDAWLASLGISPADM